jgi:hypothetical protein
MALLVHRRVRDHLRCYTSWHVFSCSTAPVEIRTAALSGVIGYSNREQNQVALELLPVEEGSDFLSYTCGSTSTEVRGELLGALSPVDSPTTSFSLNLSQSKGKQHIEGFQEGPKEVLEASVGGGPFEQLGLADKESLKSAEAVEIRSQG